MYLVIDDKNIILYRAAYSYVHKDEQYDVPQSIVYIPESKID
jgi:hypothetical protein